MKVECVCGKELEKCGGYKQYKSDDKLIVCKRCNGKSAIYVHT